MNEVITYPKFTREENKSCKLTTNDIKEIRESFKQGQSITNLSKFYSVSRPTIRYWVNEEFRGKSIAKAIAYNKIIKRPSGKKKYVQDWKQRKGIEYEKYLYITGCKSWISYIENHKEELNAQRVKYKENHKEEIKARNKVYYLNNKVKFKINAKRFIEKNPDYMKLYSIYYRNKI